MSLEYILTGEEMAGCDRRTSEEIGIPSLVLMERAALSVAEGADAFLRGSGAVLVVAGKGNNGADALAAGRILIDRGYSVRFYRLPGKISPESSFAVQERILMNYGCEVSPLSFPEKTESLQSGQRIRVIIDGLFGTGLSRELTGDAAETVAWINRLRKELGCRVIAVDIPSGISSDDGRVMGCAVKCDETRTFAFYKRGHFMYPGAAFAGELHLAQIGITSRSFARRPGMFSFIGGEPRELVSRRKPDGNKGTFGKVLIVSGRRNMCGAALLAARACLYSGAGMVKLFTHEANRVIVQQALPEAMLETWQEEDPPQEIERRLKACLGWADVAAAGPAMGTDAHAEAILRTLLDHIRSEAEQETGRSVSAAGEENGKRALPLRGLVLDADALRILSGDPELRARLAGRRRGIPCILTPHLAEFSALAHTSVEECGRNRTSLVQAQADALRCIIACKDARTLVAMPAAAADMVPEVPDKEITGQLPVLPETGKRDEGSVLSEGSVSAVQYLNVTGNSGMATAGSGDVLTGMTAALLAHFLLSGTPVLSAEWSGGRTAARPVCSLRDVSAGQRSSQPQADQAWSLLEKDADFAERLSLTPDRAAFEAAWRAVCLHGLAGDFSRDRHGERGMGAGDLVEALRERSFWEDRQSAALNTP